MTRYVLRLLLCALSALWCGAGFAKEEFRIKYSHLGMADPMVQSSGAKSVIFKAELEKLSGGRIKVDIFANGQLGGQRSSIQQVRKGTIQIADISSGVLASLYYPKLEIVDLPFVFSSRTTARMALDNKNPFIREMIEDCAKRTRIRILSLGPFGFRHITNNVRAIKSPGDMKGLKMRTMEIVAHRKLMESLGATAVPVPWLELYTSLQMNVVDGEETTLQNIMMAKLYQVQKHLTLTGHVMGVGAFLCNEKWYQSLPDDLKIAVIEAEKVSRLTYDGFGELLDAMALEKLKAEQIEVYSLTPKQMQAFRDKAFPEVRKWMEKQHGKEFVGEFLASVKAAERQLEQEMKSTVTAR